MSEFQKSLIRFMYVALVLAIAVASWAVFRPHAPAQMTAGMGRYGQPDRGVTTTGSCIVRTKPELVQVTLGVQQSSKTARSAKDYVKSTCLKIINALKQAGVAEKDIQTQHFHLTSEWTYGKGWQAIKWNAEEALRVRVRNVDSVADVIDAAVKAGANRVGQLEYSAKDLNKIRAQGREKAASVARNKAQELASSLGGKLGKLVSCSEYYPDDRDGYGYYGYYNNYYGGSNENVNAQVSVSRANPAPESGNAEEVTIQPGELVNTVVVTATYELE